MCLAFVVDLGIKVTTESGLFCWRTGRTKTFYVREAIIEHLEDLEDRYLAESALERIRSGEQQTIPLQGALKRHGLQR